MKKELRKIMAVLLVAILMLTLAGCSGSDTKTDEEEKKADVVEEKTDVEEKKDEETPDETPEETPAEVGLKIGIVTTSGVDDGSFGETCYNGILDFIAENPEATVNDIKEPDIDKVLTTVETVIADYDVLVLPGFQFSTCGSIAEQNPDKKIILVDSAPVDAAFETVTMDNIYSMVFAEQESGFLAGIAAALETKTNKVAVVNGIAFPSNVNYQYGYHAGIEYSNANYGTSAEYIELDSYSGTDVTGANVGGNYVGGFADEEGGKKLASTLIDQGVDIIFVAAGASGNGVFTAAKESDIKVIGCDTDQYDDGEYANGNIILTSALKVMETNIKYQLENIKAGTFVGANDLLMASTDSTGYVSEEGRHQLPAETIAKLNEVYEMIKDGTIAPPSNFSENTVADFKGE